MTRALKSLGILFVLFTLAAPGVCAAPQQVTLLHVNDTHSHLAAWGPKDADLDGTLGGVAKAAAIIGAQKTTNPNALFVHGGDLMNGDLFFNEYLGVPEFRLLQQVGLDVFVPGNHEFQYGPEFLAGVLDFTWPGGAGGVPIVATNIDVSGYPALGLWMTPTVVKDAGGVKVGFFGLTTPSDALARPAPVVIRADLADVAAGAVAKLRADGAQVIVGVAHVGLDVSRDIAAAVPGIDVIVNGHDHVALLEPESVERPDGGTTLIVSAGEYYRWVGRLTLSVEGDAVSLVDYELLSAGASAPAVPEVQAVVEALQAGIVERYGDVYHQQLAVADRAILENWDARHAKRDTALGDLFTDAYRDCGHTEIAIEALGFLDEGMPAGPIVGADVFRSMAYGIPQAAPTGGYIVRPFRLATFSLYGGELLGALEYALASGRDLFPQVSGLRLEFDSTRAPGSRLLVETVRVGDQPISPSRLYTITGNEGLVMFLAELGLTPHDVQWLDVSAFDAARALVQARGALGPVVTGRIRDVAAIPGKTK